MREEVRVMTVNTALKIGVGYNKRDFAEIVNEPKAAGLQAGLLYCDHQDATFLFVTLDKNRHAEQLHYNDFFHEDTFEWDSQNIQSFESDRIQAMVTNKVKVYLMARVVGKFRGKTQPFIYCGQLAYVSHDVSSSNPVHITFTCLDFQYENPNSALKELYEWKPGNVGKTISFEPDYKKTIHPDLKKDYMKPDVTERKGLVTSRIGQGYYRKQILMKWKYRCAVTNCAMPEILIASHIVPWRDATDKERLDPENGILLSPNYDALFDRYLISFSDDGIILFSTSLNMEEITKLGIDAKAKIKVNKEMLPFLTRHRSQLK